MKFGEVEVFTALYIFLKNKLYVDSSYFDIRTFWVLQNAYYGIISCEVDINHIFNLKSINYFPFNVVIKGSGQNYYYSNVNPPKGL